MRDVQPNDVGHQNMRPQGELLAASAIAQFYTFAGPGQRLRARFRSERSMCRWDCNGLPPERDCKHSYSSKTAKIRPRRVSVAKGKRVFRRSRRE
jgi:hypothetical protein